MDELISRQAAIEAVMNTEPVVFDVKSLEPHQKTKDVINALNELPSAKPTHPTPSNTLGALDCVSREDLTKGIETYFGDLPITVHYDMLALAQKLPSVQPRRGKWIGYKADDKDWQRDDGSPIFMNCSECHEAVINNGSAHWNFCPNCGADMRGDSDEKD